MNSISIQIQDGLRHFRPGAKMAGTVTWSTESAPAGVEVRLFWFTCGASPQQVGLAGRTVFSRPPARDSRRFEFVLPASPWSFRGRLAGLNWAVEAVLLPTRVCARTFLTVSPNSRVIQLHSGVPAEDLAD